MANFWGDKVSCGLCPLVLWGTQPPWRLLRRGAFGNPRRVLVALPKGWGGLGRWLFAASFFDQSKGCLDVLSLLGVEVDHLRRNTLSG